MDQAPGWRAIWVVVGSLYVVAAIVTGWLWLGSSEDGMGCPCDHTVEDSVWAGLVVGGFMSVFIFFPIALAWVLVVRAIRRRRGIENGKWTQGEYIEW